MITISKHAEARLRERTGLGKKSCERIAKKAFEQGISHSQTKGNLNKWITSVYFRSNHAVNVRILGDKAFLFSKDDVLVTVLQVPQNLARELKKYVKEDKGNGKNSSKGKV